MDGEALQFEDARFDGGLSVLGIILFSDAKRGVAEMRRVVCRGRRISIVTWTQPQNYEPAAELRAAIRAVRPEQSQAPLPAQLRYREELICAHFSKLTVERAGDYDRRRPT